jgi:hypothetical protein
MKVKRHTLIGTVAALGAAVAVLASFVGSAAAASTGTCPARTTKKAFSRYGDAGDYFFTPNGGFEGGTTGWTLKGGATVVTGNESAFLNSTSDKKALKLPANASAQTATICTNPNDQTIRLMVNGTSGQLKVDAYILSGGNIRTWSTQVDAGASGWRASPVIQFALGNQYLGATTIQLTFTALGSTWQIDDLYVDPFKGH